MGSLFRPLIVGSANQILLIHWQQLVWQIWNTDKQAASDKTTKEHTASISSRVVSPLHLEVHLMSFKKALFAVPAVAAMVAIYCTPALACPQHVSSELIPTSSYAPISMYDHSGIGCGGIQSSCSNVLTQSAVVLPVATLNTGCNSGCNTGCNTPCDAFLGRGYDRFDRRYDGGGLFGLGGLFDWD